MDSILEDGQQQIEEGAAEELVNYVDDNNYSDLDSEISYP